jgi:hypothetical protein
LGRLRIVSWRRGTPADSRASRTVAWDSGHTRFTAPNVIEVDGRELRFRKAVIATGSDPLVPPIDGLKTDEYLINETVFSLTELPPRLVVIGGGPLACELAQAFRRLGSEVDLVSATANLLRAATIGHGRNAEPRRPFGSLGRADAVLIAAGTRRLVGDFFESRDLGAVEVTGIAGLVPAWQVLRPSVVASRFEALRGSALTGGGPDRGSQVRSGLSAGGRRIRTLGPPSGGQPLTTSTS